MAKLTLGWTTNAGSIQCENVFYLQDGTDAIFTDQSTVATNVFNAASTNLKPQLFPNVSLNEVIFEDVRTTTFGAQVFSFTPQAGTKAGATGGFPSSVCLSIKKTTGNPGRSGRGRWYWPISDLSVMASQDQVGSTYAAQVVAALVAFQTAIEVSTHTPIFGLVSYTTGKALRANGLFQQITGWSTSDLFVDNQRRRLQGRGR